MADVTEESSNAPPLDSHLFTVRIWIRKSANGEAEWHGKVQHVSSGNVRYFRDWATLVAYMQQALADAASLQSA